MNESAHSIQIHVATDYMDDQSEPDADRYVFAYTITISNQGEVAAKLLSRHWVITDANGKVQEVSGDGVVGEQPYLNPGERFRYSSGAVIETPVGAMQGRYRMKSEHGDSFYAPIAAVHAGGPGPAALGARDGRICDRRSAGLLRPVPPAA